MNSGEYAQENKLHLPDSREQCDLKYQWHSCLIGGAVALNDSRQSLYIIQHSITALQQ